MGNCLILFRIWPVIPTLGTGLLEIAAMLPVKKTDNRTVLSEGCPVFLVMRLSHVCFSKTGTGFKSNDR